MSVTMEHFRGERIASVPVIALSDRRAKRTAARRLRTRLNASVTEDDVLWVTGLIIKRVVVKLD